MPRPISESGEVRHEPLLALRRCAQPSRKSRPAYDRHSARILVSDRRLVSLDPWPAAHPYGVRTGLAGSLDRRQQARLSHKSCPCPSRSGVAGTKDSQAFEENGYLESILPNRSVGGVALLRMVRERKEEPPIVFLVLDSHRNFRSHSAYVLIECPASGLL